MPWADKDKWVGIDGEGVGNDYVLLDSSEDDYPPAYAASGHLSSLQCLDWVWGLAERRMDAQFCIYGADYDFNDWLRDISFEGLCELTKGEPIQVGPYVIQWMRKFAFNIKRLRVMGDTTKAVPKWMWNGERQYERIRGKAWNGQEIDRSVVTIWDVHPFHQTSFENAIDKVLGNEVIDRELIADGKKLRGKFTHEIMDWVRRYNKAELYNLTIFMSKFDVWLDEAEIKISNYNGPGAIAKKELRSHDVVAHSGRYFKQGKYGFEVKEYNRLGKYGPELWEAVLYSFAGGRNEQPMIGRAKNERFKSYDIVSAYPAAMIDLPCLTHGQWVRHTKFVPGFGIWKYTYDNPNTNEPLYPFFHRTKDGRICYPPKTSGWAMTPEIESALSDNPCYVTIHEGYVWEPEPCSNPFPLAWVADLFSKRRAHKKAGREGASTVLKLAINSIYGSVAQSRGGTEELPPPTQQLFWASWITSATRAKMRNAIKQAPYDICHIATDGLISRVPLDLDIGTGLGQWEEEELRDLTIVQYGCYRAEAWDEKKGEWKEKIRTRSIPIADFDLKAVYAAWRAKESTIEVKRKLFITAGLVASGAYSKDLWCTWKEYPEDFCVAPSDYRMPMSHPSPDELIRMQNTAHILLGDNTQSYPYQPHWGKGEWVPDEWLKEDTLESALAVAEMM